MDEIGDHPPTCNSIPAGITAGGTRLRGSDRVDPGIFRRHCGTGFSYRRPDGSSVDTEEKQRSAALTLPSAWTDFWMCPWLHGHIQATGVDAAGRTQYRYDDWHHRRGREKFDRVLAFGRLLPALRAAVDHHIALGGMPRERVLPVAVRLLDIGAFRIGSEVHAEQNETFGLATLRKDHVRIRNETLQFAYTAKGGVERQLELRDDAALDVVAT